MKDLVRSSYKHCYEEEVRKAVGDDVFGSQELDDCGSENVVRINLVNQKFHASLLSAIERLTVAKLQLDKFGFATRQRLKRPPASFHATKKRCSPTNLPSSLTI